MHHSFICTTLPIIRFKATDNTQFSLSHSTLATLIHSIIEGLNQFQNNNQGNLPMRNMGGFREICLYFGGYSEVSYDNLTMNISLPWGDLPTKLFSLPLTPDLMTGFGYDKDQLKAEFEILEVELNDKDEIETLAANITHHAKAKGDAPLFGAIRYNSLLPIEASVSDIYSSHIAPHSFFYYIEQNLNTGKLENPVFYTSHETSFTYWSYSDENEGVVINIANEFENLWLIELTLAEDEKDPQILIESKACTYTDGEFYVKEIVKDRWGKIQNLAIDFKARNRMDTSIQGSLRYQSNTLINLERPYLF
jgi:hypothetical protein